DNPLALACKVYPLPGLSTVSVEKVATPATADTVLVPPSVAPPGLAPNATVTWLVALVTGLPSASWIPSRTAGVVVPPATRLLGCCTKTSREALPAVRLMALDGGDPEISSRL